MAKCSREQRDRAVDLYVRYERYAADVIRELGYPSRGMLPVWYRERLEEERTGVPSRRGERYRRYTDEQKRAAVDHYLGHGRRLKRTMRALGYPKSHELLTAWIDELAPGRRKLRHGPVPEELKRKAVVAVASGRSESRDAAAGLGVEASENSKRGYGYKRVHLEPESMGVRVSAKRVMRLTARHGLAPLFKSAKRYGSYKGEPAKAPKNLVNRDFHAERPNMLWVTDPAGFSIPAGKAYLSPVIDCYDGLPVAWTIGTSPNAALANGMLADACSTLKDGEKPIIHSDRGCHYRWPEWIRICKEHGLTRSMSAKGCSPDNAAAEGFFGRLKQEFFHKRSFAGVASRIPFGPTGKHCSLFDDRKFFEFHWLSLALSMSQTRFVRSVLLGFTVVFLAIFPLPHRAASCRAARGI